MADEKMDAKQEETPPTQEETPPVKEGKPVAKEEKAPVDDDVPIGEMMAKELEKERQEMADDLESTGTAALGQGDDEVDKVPKKKGVLGKLFGKTEQASSPSESSNQSVGAQQGMAPGMVQPGMLQAGSGIPMVSAENFVNKIEFEKYKVKLDTQIERAKFFEESNQKTAEEIGELRAMNFKNDKLFSETEMKLKKLEQMIALIEPEKLAVELRKRKKEILQNEVRINKIDNMTTEAFKRASKVEQIFEDIGDVKTLVELRKELNIKLVKSEKLRDESERFSKLAEKMFAEINKKLVDFETQKAKIKRNEEIVKNMIQEIDLNKNKIGGSLTREEFESKFKEVQEELNIVKTLSSVDDIRHVLERLEDKRKEIKGFLNTIVDDYKKGLISKIAYEETFESNQRALKLIRYKIQEIEKNKIKLIKEQGEENLANDEVEREIENALNSDRKIKVDVPKIDQDAEPEKKTPEKAKSDDEKYQELQGKIKVWKEKGYNVDALEEELVALR